jgi:hypothetical protein
VQVAYYQSGIGTSWSTADKFLGGGLALGLSENIREAYGFLVNNYQGTDGGKHNDELYFVGFSRGAYTARSVAGMIGALGLLEKSAMSHFYAVYDDFENAGDADYVPKLPTAYPKFEIKVSPKDLNAYLTAYKKELLKHRMTRLVKVKAIGVFDTVGSLGVPVVPWLQRIGFPTTLRSYRFFDTGVDDHVENAFQVLALDEHRSAFGPTVWSKRDNGSTNLKQIWIPGVHTNAGGGADDDGMANISLAWMMDQLGGKDVAGENMLEFDDDYIKDQLKATNEDYKTRHKIDPLKWGFGKLGNSMKFPTSMAGSVTRTPLDYFITDYGTGKATTERLTNTHELIHASVRLRYGKGQTYDGRPYESAALAGWVKPESGGPRVWKHRSNKELKEDSIGRFERLLIGSNADLRQELGLEPPDE